MLTIQRFAEYFHALWGHDPFPWQVRLAERVHRDGAWPAALDLPTGSGKTAALDIAVFTLALEPTGAARRLPLRTILVVDRRTIVDQATLRARALADRLASEPTGILGEVAAALRRFTATVDDQPLLAASMRGAMPRDDAWARTPTQPLVAASTVDQVGSRLLFRGYGIGRGSRSIHAGLLGQDTLFLLDEVHLSQPFKQTLSAIGLYRGWNHSTLLVGRWGLVELSATRAPGAEPAFDLDARDRDHPVLARRLGARKPCELVEVAVAGSETKRREMFCSQVADRVLAELDCDTPLVAGVIHNRVDLALRTWRLLRARLDPSIPVLLATGRMRPLDRQDRELELTALAGAGRDRTTGQRGVVVATQCIEAGADLDFDVLVSECASLDALVQRMGRLNRRGVSAAPRGVVMHRSDQVAEGSDDPIYGLALQETWAFLLAQEGLDFGINTLPTPGAEGLGALLPPLRDAPVLLPVHLDLLSQTLPEPYPDPDVALFLHGEQHGPPEVSVVWRADLSRELLAGNPELALQRLDAVQPGSTEAVSLPIYAVAEWLRGGQAADVDDTEASALPDDEVRQHAPSGQGLAVLWRGQRGAEVGDADDLRPGDVVVVPSYYGGLESGTWSPARGVLLDSTLEDARCVEDFGDRVQLEQRGRAVLRLEVNALRSYKGVDLATPPRVQADEAEDAELSDRERAEAWLHSIDVQRLWQPWARQVIGRLLAGPFDIVGVGADDGGADLMVLRARRRIRWDQTHEVSTEDDSASYTGVQVPLSDHLAGVDQLARTFAEALGLPAELIDAMGVAAGAHDLGKADPRFQAWLHGGSRYLADVAQHLLAKSDQPPGPARWKARLRSAYPDGARHELLSLAMLQDHAVLDGIGGHRDLVLHLVGSHHGRCRPLAPVVVDPAPQIVEVEQAGHTFSANTAHGLEALDSGVARRFWALQEQYGWHGLAWLEAVLRLADQRRSEWEQRNLGGNHG